MRAGVAFLILAQAASTTSASVSNANLNPIRKVVTMLQAMQKKVTEEGEKEEKLYDKFMCYCTKGDGDLSASISAATTKVPAVSSGIEAAESKLVQTKETLKQAQVDRTAAQDAMAEATAIREKEAASFAKEKAEYDANIAAIAKAVTALENGMAGAFLQTGAAQAIRQLALKNQDMTDGDRQELIAFLSGTHGVGYVPQSGEITGILKELGDDMAKHLADATAAENEAIQSYQELMSAKKKEVAALSAAVETKTQQVGELGVSIAQMKDDLSDTEAALEADQKFLAELKTSCATKTAEWEERKKTRADELVALAETIKVLNDDDALELFKKTLPSASASFVQVASSRAKTRVRALTVIRAARHGANTQDHAGLDFLMLALSSKKSMSHGGFDKVIKMIDDMVATLKKEQQDDNDKQEYCSMQFDTAEDKKKAVEHSLADAESKMAVASDAIATLTEEIAALEAGIKALDKSVAEATEQRKAENVEFKDLMASNSAAKELLGFAKNRLNKFYNPKLYKAPPKRELSEEDRISVNMGGTAPPTPPPGGIADTGVTVLAQISRHAQQKKDAPATPPETWGAYRKKSEGSTGVIAMIDLLIKDLDKEMTEAETEERDSQADYEAMMGDSAEKRTADAKSLTQKKAAKADTEAELEAHKDTKASAGKELMATMKYISSLHAECDWLLQYFDVRKEARAGEIDALKNAKAVLSGADFSLAQTRAKGFLGRFA